MTTSDPIRAALKRLVASADEFAADGFVLLPEDFAAARAALAKACPVRDTAERLQLIAISERPPAAKDCDSEGRCWWLVLHQSWPCLYLMKANNTLVVDEATHWLPFYALSIPTSTPAQEGPTND